MKHILVLTLIGFFLSGCTSYFKRKECEKINWFEHGQKVALRGDRLNADNMVNECRKVEADIRESQLDLGYKSGMQRYCEPPNAYQVGRVGDKFVRDLCEGPNIRQILAQHQKGVNDYCQKVNAYQAGASGKKYQNVCTPEQEKSFLPPYRKGRKKWAEATIADKESLVKEKDAMLTQLQREQEQLRWQQNGLQNERSMLNSQKNAYTPNSAEVGHYDGRISNLDMQISSVDSQLSGTRSRLNQTKAEQDQLRQSISELRAELAGLSED